MWAPPTSVCWALCSDFWWAINNSRTSLTRPVMTWCLQLDEHKCCFRERKSLKNVFSLRSRHSLIFCLHFANSLKCLTVQHRRPSLKRSFSHLSLLSVAANTTCPERTFVIWSFCPNGLPHLLSVINWQFAFCQGSYRPSLARLFCLL